MLCTFLFMSYISTGDSLNRARLGFSLLVSTVFFMNSTLFSTQDSSKSFSEKTNSLFNSENNSHFPDLLKYSIVPYSFPAWQNWKEGHNYETVKGSVVARGQEDSRGTEKFCRDFGQ